MSGLPFSPISTVDPKLGPLPAIRTIRQMHQHFFAKALKDLRGILDPQPETEALGIGFLAMDRDSSVVTSGMLATIRTEQDCKVFQVDAWRWRTRNPLRVVLCGWLHREDYLAQFRERTSGTRGWMPGAVFFGPEGSTAFFDHLGIAFSEPLAVDLFHHLPDGSLSGKTSSRLGSENWLFDYSARSGDLSGLCYTRCRWGSDDLKGLVLDREPGSCWESHHNTLLQAAAPMMYETLRALARESPSAHPLVLAALGTVEDSEWDAHIWNQADRAFSGAAATAMEIACGLGITRMKWRIFYLDYVRSGAVPPESTDYRDFGWLVSGYVEGMCVAGEVRVQNQWLAAVRLLHPYRRLSMSFELRFSPGEPDWNLSLPDRLTAESSLAGLYLLGAWIELQWPVLLDHFGSHQARLRDLRVPPFHEKRALEIWHYQLERRLKANEISQGRFEQEIEWVSAENAAYDRSLSGLKRTFFNSLPYPGPRASSLEPSDSIGKFSQWALPLLTDELQDQIFSLLESGHRHE